MDWLAVTKDTFSSVVSLARSASLSKPLAIVPTTAWQYSVDDLREAGFKLIIYANQQLRAAAKAMEAVMIAFRLRDESTRSLASWPVSTRSIT